MEAKIVCLPGDGIGPEVIEQTVRVLEAVANLKNHRFSFTYDLIGGCSIDQFGIALRDEVIDRCKNSDAVLLGAVGGPKWDNPLAKVRPEQGLLRLRKELGVYANLRPVYVYPSLFHISPVKPERLENVDLVVVRELTGGLYFGEPKGRFTAEGHVKAVDTLTYYDYEIERIIDLAFRLARARRKKVSSVDKANVLESSRLWRQTAVEVAKKYPDITLEHVLVDTASMKLIQNPASFDVIVTENMFGDILTDEASVLSGSMGLLPSASLGASKPGLYEPIHGSAPDIAGKGIANPIGAILSGAMLLRYSLNLEQEAGLIEKAVQKTINQGYTTTDLGGNLSTREITEIILSMLSAEE